MSDANTGSALDVRQTERVARRIEQFKRKCGEHGEEALNFAYHAALPVALNPEFLHLLRINFFLDIERPLPYEVEFEFLLSSLCRQIDEGLYEVERDVRLVLLGGLAREFGQERMREVAMLLWEYVESQEPWAERVGLGRAQRLTSLNFLVPEHAQNWLNLAQSNVRGSYFLSRDWLVAMQSEISTSLQLQDAIFNQSQIIEEDIGATFENRGFKRTILIVEFNPWQDLSLNQEIRDLTGVIERARDRDAFKIEQGLAVRTEDLLELMMRHEPKILHFCGHGSGEEGMVLQDSAQQPRAVTTEALSSLFRLRADYVDCVVLNACYSGGQAEAIVAHVDYVIGMQQTIRDDAAQHFAQGFYRALGYGKPIEVAYEWGCNAIQLMLASEGDGRTRDSAIPQRRQIGQKAVVKGSGQALPEHLKPRLFKRSALGKVKLVEAKQPTAEELEDLEQALEQEDALEQYREKVREFLEDHELSAFEEIRLRQFQRRLGLSDAEAEQILAEEEAPLKEAREDYAAILVALLEAGAYPFDEQTLGELRQFREQLHLTDGEVTRIEDLLLATTERVS